MKFLKPKNKCKILTSMERKKNSPTKRKRIKLAAYFSVETLIARKQ